MNVYTYEQKENIRHFFDETVPKFPFIVHAKPYSKVNVTTIREFKKLCKDIVYPVPEGVISFLKNIADRDFEYNASPFEYDIMQTQGFMSFLYIYEASKHRLKETTIAYAWEYIRRYKNNDVNNLFVTVVPIITIPPMPHEYDIDYYQSVSNESYLFMKMIQHADLHQVVAFRQDGDFLEIPLAKILHPEYKGYDIDASGGISSKLDLNGTDREKATSLIQAYGLQEFILPDYVYEVKTKC